MNGQRRAKRDFRTNAKSVDPDQPPRLRRRVWSGSALFDNYNINDNYFSCYVNNFTIYRCFQHRIGADLGLHYMKCLKVPFRVTLAIYTLSWKLTISRMHSSGLGKSSPSFFFFFLKPFMYSALGNLIHRSSLSWKSQQVSRVIPLTWSITGLQIRCIFLFLKSLFLHQFLCLTIC